MKCPNCNADILVSMKALEEEKMSMKLKYDGDFLQAKNVGGIITETARILSDISDSMKNEKGVMVAFGGFEKGDHEFTIHFIVTEKSKQEATGVI
jgi:hypothetical protein